MFTPWGEIRAGRDYDATFWNLAYFDVNGANGLGQGTNLTPLQVGGNGANSLVRVNGTIEYLLPPNIGGWYGQAQVSAPSNNAANGNPAQTGQKYYGGRLGYAAGPFDVAGAYGETKLTSFNGDAFKVWNVGGSWDFGVAKLFGYYHEAKFRTLKADTYELSMSVPIGLGEIRTSYAHLNQNGTLGALTTDANDAQMYSIGYVYNVSKRTALYTTFGQIKNKGNAAFTVLPGTPTDSALAGGKSTGYNLGVRHSFLIAIPRRRSKPPIQAAFLLEWATGPQAGGSLPRAAAGAFCKAGLDLALFRIGEAVYAIEDSCRTAAAR